MKKKRLSAAQRENRERLFARRAIKLANREARTRLFDKNGRMIRPAECCERICDPSQCTCGQVSGESFTARLRRVRTEFNALGGIPVPLVQLPPF
jgi:hypothetical protein